jgi:hypothetical protein
MVVSFEIAKDTATERRGYRKKSAVAASLCRGVL